MGQIARIFRFFVAWFLTFCVTLVAFLLLIPADENGEVTLGIVHLTIILVVPILIGRFFSKVGKQKISKKNLNISSGPNRIVTPQTLNGASSQASCVESAPLVVQYDFTSAAGIMAIPGNQKQLHLEGRDDLAIDRCLRQKGFEYEKAGKMDLAILCLKKSNEIRFSSRRGYRIEDYYSLVGLLARCDQIKEAQAEKARIDSFFGDNDIDSAIDYATTNIKNLQDYAESLNTDLVIMNPHGMSCSKCAKYQGRVFSLSGQDRRFPRIPSEFYLYGGIHEGCVHGFSPYIHGLTDPMLDYTLSFQTGVAPQYRKNIIAFSNRPFVDDRLPEDIAKAQEHADKLANERAQRQYYRDHIIEIEAQRGIDQRNYQWLQKNLPSLCPKSYSGYMRMKKGNTKNFQNLAAKASDLGRDLT